MSALAQNDDSEFQMLMKEHRTQIHAYLIAILGNTADAEDVLQGAMMLVWDKRSDFEIGTNFGAWARKVAWFQAQNFIRKHTARGETPLIDESMIVATNERIDERELEFTRHRRALRLCLEKLPDRQREVVEGRFFDTKSVEEIADAMGMKTNAISQLIFRAKSNLVDCVKRESRSNADSLREI